MARGQIAKKKVANKILQAFPGSFEYNNGKEIRIPVQEEGEQIQIKVTLTAAKVNVEPGEDNALPGDSSPVVVVGNAAQPTLVSETKVEMLKPTEEEKKNVSALLAQLGM